MEKKKQSKKKILLPFLLLLCLICLFLVQCALKNKKESSEPVPEQKQEVVLPEPVIKQDSVKTDTLEKEIVKEEPPKKAPKKEKTDSLKLLEKIKKDSLKKLEDSLKFLEAINKKRLEDSLRVLESLAKLPKDTTPPNAYLTPPPGRYFDPIKLKVKCEERKCKTWLSVGDTLNPVSAEKGAEYNKKGIVFFRAEDSVGNVSAWQTGEYDMASDNKCKKNAYPVPVNGKEVCVDAYEYPNIPGETPRDMVSHEQAKTLCENAGKRLCTIEEWQAACKGRDNLKYSYGNTYKPFSCNANTNAASRTGRKTLCRSWWGMYDMNGNLWEWTATPSKEKSGAFLVAGGSWNVNNQSRCTESSYSFYSQNTYNSVGFRCCQDMN